LSVEHVVRVLIDAAFDWPAVFNASLNDYLCGSGP
jgi:hypothetical protein